MENQMTLDQLNQLEPAEQKVEYVATCPVCGGYVMVFNAQAQDFSCTCCKRVWLDGAVKIKGIYE